MFCLPKTAWHPTCQLLARVEPGDLTRFGMIPEFVGRVPVLATLDELDEGALVSILTEPKNSLLKQYQKLFSLEGVKLRFTEGSLKAIAKKAVQRKTGARGLRAILEDVMLDLMYDIPSQSNVKEVIINEEVITERESPIMLYEKDKTAPPEEHKEAS